jgi:hypothetical protein
MQDRKPGQVINGHWDVTHEEVGAALGISRQGAALAERRALEKLRKGLARKGYGPEVVIEALRHLDQARW